MIEIIMGPQFTAVTSQQFRTYESEDIISVMHLQRAQDDHKLLRNFWHVLTNAVPSFLQSMTLKLNRFSIWTPI
jgi:hypothetical protein